MSKGAFSVVGSSDSSSDSSVLNTRVSKSPCSADF